MPHPRRDAAQRRSASHGVAASLYRQVFNTRLAGLCFARNRRVLRTLIKRLQNQDANTSPWIFLSDRLVLKIGSAAMLGLHRDRGLGALASRLPSGVQRFGQPASLLGGLIECFCRRAKRIDNGFFPGARFAAFHDPSGHAPEERRGLGRTQKGCVPRAVAKSDL